MPRRRHLPLLPPIDIASAIIYADIYHFPSTRHADEFTYMLP